MLSARITRKEFLEDSQGRTFADVLNDPEQPFGEVLEFFNGADQQRRMEESETHHDRAPMAGVVRELESQPATNQFLATKHPRRSQRLRQAIGVLVRMIMERRRWRKTGKKGSLGVRNTAAQGDRITTPVVWLSGSFVPSDMSPSRARGFPPCKSAVRN